MEWLCLKFNDLSNLQLYSITQLREKVFIVEQDCPYLDADGKDIKAKHLMGFEKDQLMAYARLLPPGVSYEEISIGRFITDESIRGIGAGKELMKKCLEQMNKDFPGQDIRISAQKYLFRFYNSFGFKQVGEEYLEDGIPHIEMLKCY